MMIVEVISIIVFANLLGFLFMWMGACEKNICSRTEHELKLLEEENKNN